MQLTRTTRQLDGEATPGPASSQSERSRRLRPPSDLRARTALYGLLLVAAMLVDGVALFWIAIAITLLSCSLHIRRWLTVQEIRVAVAWEVGYLLVIAVDGVSNSSEIEAIYGRGPLVEATTYLVAAQALVMLTYSLLAAPLFRRRPIARRPMIANRLRSRTLIAALGVFYFVMVTPGALRAFREGRVGTRESPFDASAFGAASQGLVQAAGILLPGLIAFHILYLSRRPSVLKAYLLALPVLVSLYVVGTRFPLVIAVAGLVGVHWSSTTARSRRLLVFRTGLVLVAVALALATMTQFRARGLALSEVEISIDQILDEAISGEGVVLASTELAIFFGRNEHLQGSSHLAIATILLPREWWPNKPTLIGYWFPREFGRTGFGTGHSISVGFAGDAYADFGAVGGLALMPALGLALALLERWIGRAASAGGPGLVLCSAMFGVTFFAVRSLVTAAIVVVGVLTILAGYHLMARLKPYSRQLQ